MHELKTVTFDASLLPCPFCGGNDLEIANTHTASFWVACNDCDAEVHGDYVEGPQRDDKFHYQAFPDDSRLEASYEDLYPEYQRSFRSAVLAWNTRAPTPAAQSAGPMGYAQGYEDAIEAAAFYVLDHCTDGYTHAEALRTMTRPDAAQSAGQEVIRQVKWHEGDGWVDVDRETFAEFADKALHKRIVYAAPVSAGQEMVAWYDPTNRDPKQAVTFDRRVMEEWPHIYSRPLYAAPVNGGERELRALAEEYQAKLDAEDNPNLQRVLVGMRDGLKLAANVVSGKVVQRAADAPQECQACVGKGFNDVDRQVAERKSDVQTFREECEARDGTGKVSGDMTAKEFHRLCRLLPPDVAWGASLSPAIVRHIVAALSSPVKEEQKPMTDRQIIELCESVGVEWEGPDRCDFMGDFGRVNMAGMRAIINAAKEQK